MLILTRPDVIESIHDAFLAAGADITATGTFGATRIAQADYGLEDLAYEMNLEGARICRRVADAWTARTPEQPRFVAGAMGPTTRTLSISPDVNDPGKRALGWRELCDAFAEQARGLLDGGVDLLLVETQIDTLNTKAALVAIDEVCAERGVRVPVVVSMAVTDSSGRTLSGQTLDAFYHSVRHATPLAVGLNCSLGAEQLRPHLAELAELVRPPRLRLPERRASQRDGRLRREPGAHRGARRRVGEERPREPGGRLLRHHARAHRRGREGRRRRAPAAAPDGARTTSRVSPAWRRSRSGPTATSSRSASARTSRARRSSAG